MFRAEAEQLRTEDMRELLNGGGGQAACFGIAYVCRDCLLDRWECLRDLDIFTAQRGALVLAGEEFGMFPGLRLRRNTESSRPTGQSPVYVFGAGALLGGSVGGVRTTGLMACKDE